MPYQRNADLPKSVRDSLPPVAQTIYRKVFNSAWMQYDEAKKRRGHTTREATAHRVAWAAVKQSYRKVDHRWARKD